MPQPFLSVVRGQKDIDFQLKLPMHNPALCAAAMNIIASWSEIERDMSHAVVAMVRGKAEPIAKILTGRTADAPKKAIRDLLAATFLPADEFAIFESLDRRYETCSKLRNPLAHWVLGFSPQVPDGIIAQDPIDHIRINAAEEGLRDAMLAEMADPQLQHLDANERLSHATGEKMKATSVRHLETFKVYREADFRSIHKELDELLQCIRVFTVAVRMRHMNLELEKYSSLLKQLSQRLGLPQTKAG